MGVSETTGEIITGILLLPILKYMVQTTQDLSQRIVTLSWSENGVETHLRSGSHLRITLSIIIRAQRDIPIHLANANDAICPLNRTPMCTKFWKAINRGANDQSPNVNVENHARSLNQITRKSKSTDRNSVSRAGSAIVYVA